MTARLRSFAAFWYDFVVGDDWRVAVGVVAALVFTWLVGRTGAAAWWVAPLCVAVILPLSLWRVARQR
jgi:hypothetical protein